MSDKPELPPWAVACAIPWLGLVGLARAQATLGNQRLAAAARKDIREHGTHLQDRQRTIANGFCEALMSAQQCIGIAGLLERGDLAAEAEGAYRAIFLAYGRLIEMVQKMDEAQAEAVASEEKGE